MISFEKFESYIKEYKELLEKEDNLNEALQAFSPDFGGFYLENVHELFPKLLRELTNDKDDWIGYYIYELNWGKDYKDGYVTAEDGSIIKLKTIEDLYCLLESEYNYEEKK